MAVLTGITWGMNGVVEGTAYGTVSDKTNTSFTGYRTPSDAMCYRGIRFYPTTLLPANATLTKITANFTFSASYGVSHYASIWAEGDDYYSDALVKKSGLGESETSVSLSVDASSLSQYSDGSVGLGLGVYMFSTASSYCYFTDVSFDLEYTAPTITVVTEASPAEGGTVTGGGTYESGSTVTAAAAPNDGYVFSHWLVNGVNVGNSNPISGTLTADTVVTAVFDATEASSVFLGTKKITGVYLGTEKVFVYCGTEKLI